MFWLRRIFRRGWRLLFGDPAKSCNPRYFGRRMKAIGAADGATLTRAQPASPLTPPQAPALNVVPLEPVKPVDHNPRYFGRRMRKL